MRLVRAKGNKVHYCFDIIIHDFILLILAIEIGQSKKKKNSQLTFQNASQFFRKENISEFALLIRSAGLVLLVAVEVGKIDGPPVVGHAGDRYDATFRTILQFQ